MQCSGVVVRRWIKLGSALSLGAVDTAQGRLKGAAPLAALTSRCSTGIPNPAAAAKSSTAAAAQSQRTSRCMAATSPPPAPASPPAAAPAGAELAPLPPPKPLMLVVAVVLLDGEGQVLLAQRPPGKKLAGLWEFPGGKVDPGESPEAALVRELHEELGIKVAPAALTPLTFASHAYNSFHLLMPTYVCTEWDGEVVGAEGQALAWVAASELEGGRYAMPPADLPLLAPVLGAMRQRGGKGGSGVAAV